MNLQQATVRLRSVRDRIITINAAEASLVRVVDTARGEMRSVHQSGIRMEGLGAAMAAMDDVEASVYQVMRACRALVEQIDGTIG